MKGFKFGQTTTQNTILDMPVSRHDLGSYFEAVLGDLGPQKWTIFETTTRHKNRTNKNEQTLNFTAVWGWVDNGGYPPSRS